MTASDGVGVLYVVGAMHSGSTALGLVLAQHSQVAPLSQPEWLGEYIADPRSPCTCGRAIVDCPFWRRVVAELARDLGLPFDERLYMYLGTASTFRTGPVQRAWLTLALGVGARSFSTRLARISRDVEWDLFAARCNHTLFEAVRRVTGKSVVVDASKIPSRGKLLYMTERRQTRLLWLVRDGRAVAWSRMRRTGVSIERATLAWVRANLEIAAALATVQSAHWMRLQYESLCLSPSPAMARICRFVGLPVEPVSLALDKRGVHLVGGNPMRYRTEERFLKLDDQWKRALTRRQLASFRALGGWLNCLLGYDT